MRGRSRQGVWDGQVHTDILKMDNQQGHTLDTGNTAQRYAAAWMGGEFGRDRYMYMCVYICLVESF